MIATQQDEQLIRLASAASLVEKLTGERPHVSTMHRWALRGSSGVRLKTKYALGAKRTTAAWVREFIDEVDLVRTGEVTPHPSELRSKKSRLSRIKAELDAELSR